MVTNLKKFLVFFIKFPNNFDLFLGLKRPDVNANGHVFIAGLINDVVMGFPLGISSLSYLIIIFVVRT